MNMNKRKKNLLGDVDLHLSDFNTESEAGNTLSLE